MTPLRTFFISIMDLPLMSDNLQGLAELAHRSFALAEQYPAGSNFMTLSDDVPCHIMLHRFAAVLYTPNSYPDYSPAKAVLCQNWPSRPAPVVIDFRAMTAVCDGQETNLAIEPEQITRAAEGIDLHIRDVWGILGWRDLKDQLDGHLDWSDFLQNLKSNGMLPADASTFYFDLSSIHKQCPRCTMQTSHCKSCRAAICLNKTCAVSRVIPFYSCSKHISEVMCVQCWEPDSLWKWPPIDQCPHCKLWFCDREVTWCFGRPGRGYKHSARPIGCFSCIADQELPECAGTECGSREGELRTSVCGLCSPEGGVWCRCRQFWICSSCKEGEHSGFTQCPRCKSEFCNDTHGCNCIGYCADCNKATLCEDCFEEDWSGFKPGMEEKVVVLNAKCYNSRCGKSICADCLVHAACSSCHKTFCSSCLQFDSEVALCSPCSSIERLGNMSGF